MAEIRNQRVNFRLKPETFALMQQLADTYAVKDLHVFVTQKLILPYARRMNPDREYAKTPLKRKIPYIKSKANKPFHLMFTEDEMKQYDKVVRYHYFIDANGQRENSKFLTCLIYNAAKIYEDEKIQKVEEEEYEPEERISLDDDDDNWAHERDDDLF